MYEDEIQLIVDLLQNKSKEIQLQIINEVTFDLQMSD